MCGVVFLKSKDYKDLDLFFDVFKNSSIRGLHASGVSFIDNNGQMKIIKEPIPVHAFIDQYKNKIKDRLEKNENIEIMGHTRYSTSSIEYNQPLFENNTSLALNGVITQEDPSLWEDHYGYSFSTQNDAEILLKSFLDNVNPFSLGGSLASVIMSPKKSLFFRNGFRPLYYSEDGGRVIVGSTKSILERSGIENSNSCIPGSVYIVKNDYKVKPIEFEKTMTDWQV